MRLNKIKGNSQKMLCFIGNKGTGLFHAGNVHKFIISKLPTAENHVAIVFALVINIFNFLQCMIDVFVKNAAKIVLCYDPVNGLEGYTGADYANGYHVVLQYQFAECLSAFYCTISIFGSQGKENINIRKFLFIRKKFILLPALRFNEK